MNTAAELVERCVGETLTYYAFPDIHWQKIMQLEAVALIKCARILDITGSLVPGVSCIIRRRPRAAQILIRNNNVIRRQACLMAHVHCRICRFDVFCEELGVE